MTVEPLQARPCRRDGRARRGRQRRRQADGAATPRGWCLVAPPAWPSSPSCGRSSRSSSSCRQPSTRRARSTPPSCCPPGCRASNFDALFNDPARPYTSWYRELADRRRRRLARVGLPRRVRGVRLLAAAVHRPSAGPARTAAVPDVPGAAGLRRAVHHLRRGRRRPAGARPQQRVRPHALPTSAARWAPTCGCSRATSTRCRASSTRRPRSTEPATPGSSSP